MASSADHGTVRAAGAVSSFEGIGGTLDSVTLKEFDEVIHTTTGTTAGPWVVRTGPWKRPNNWNASHTEESGSTWRVGPEGSSNGNKTAVVTASTLAITVGTTSCTVGLDPTPGSVEEGASVTSATTTAIAGV